jgi:hypothetical protein
MPCQPNVKICTHIKVTGHSCGSPALSGEKFCYFHQRMIRGVRTPPQSRIHPMALIEDPEGIQVALIETVNAIVRNTIDLKRAALILRALSIATHNARRFRFDRQEAAMVRAIPEYPPAPAASEKLEKTESEKLEKEETLARAPQRSLPEAQAPRKPPARATSAPVAQAQAVNAHPQRE